MERMRDVLRGQLGRSLRALPEMDRLRAAWPVACGRLMAERGAIVGFAEGYLTVEAEDTRWQQQMRAMQGVLAAEMARIADVPVRGIHFELKGRASRKVRTAADVPAGVED